MGHIAARVVSSETVSLSLVSSIFKRFLSSDNGTSAEVFACLKRSSVAIDELIEAKTLKSKGNTEQDKCTGHGTLEGKAPCDGHGGSEGKKQLGLEGEIVDAKRGRKSDKLGKVGRREHEGHQQSVDGEKIPISKHLQSERVDLDDTVKGHRHKKHEKNSESLDGYKQPDVLERDSSKEQKEREDEVLAKEHGKKHHKVHHVLDHNMPTNELEKELREKHMKEPSKMHKRYQQVQEVVRVEDPTADTVNDETEKKKKRKKKIGEGEDGGQEDELHRDKKKRRKENQKLQP